MNNSKPSRCETPKLIYKLCGLFSKKDPAVSSKLFEIALKFLSTSSESNEKQYPDVHQVASLCRKNLNTVSPEKVKLFDQLYTKMLRSTVLAHKSEVLVFLLNISSGTSNNFNKCSMMLQDLSISHSMSTIKSQLNFLPDDPRVGVKKIYQRNLSNKSSVTIQHTNKISTTNTWNPSEQDLSKDRSVISSRTTLQGCVSESQLIQEIIYSFQGIEGKIIRKEPGEHGFTIDPKFGKSITMNQRGRIIRLTGIGFLHHKLKSHCDEADKQIGLMGQSLIATLRDELTNYYQLIALLQAQCQRQDSEVFDLTLRRMIVWVAEPQEHLQWLAYIVEQCSDKKGGALVSAVHGFLQHGSLNVQKISSKVLSAVCRPLYLMLSKWLLDGELNDPCGEFFIEARSINAADRLWYDKYHVRKAMIPSFISLDQANKILATGKSINFLRQICKDNEELPGRDALQKLFKNTSAETLFTPEQSLELHSALESVYRETSLRVLDLLKYKFRLLEHLQALRRYLLLGQGDFIRHLLELLAPELCKSANNLYGHTLTGILESAIRVTNAQYEDEDTLQRLNVGLMENSYNDVGWDIFTLVYIVDGPVGTIFQPTAIIYKCLFGALWKTKRMEFVLSNMRKMQISGHKLYRCIKEIRPVSHAIHVVTSEMIHFLHQTQYYFLFEVLECSWAEMLRQVNHAVSLDDVIAAHNTFLNSVQTGVLLDSNSEKLRLQLGLIFNQIISLEGLQETLYAAAKSEKESYNAYCAVRDSTGTNNQLENERRERAANFHQFLSTIKTQILVLSNSFKTNVIQYVTLLAGSSDMNLQLLATRLNFNDHYKLT